MSTGRLARGYYAGFGPVCNRLALYAVVLGCALLLTLALLAVTPFLGYSVENARYVLSAMAQAEASIVAIVVTVSLVAFQLRATTYSAALAYALSRNPDMWLLLLLYAIAVTADLLVLRALPDTSQLWLLAGAGHVEQSVSLFDVRLLVLPYWLLVACLAALYPYLQSAIRLFNPGIVVRRLVPRVRLSTYESMKRRSVGRSVQAIRHVGEVALSSAGQLQSEVVDLAVAGLGEAIADVVAVFGEKRASDCSTLLREFVVVVDRLGIGLSQLSEVSALESLVSQVTAALRTINWTSPPHGRILLPALAHIATAAARKDLWGPVAVALKDIAEAIRDPHLLHRLSPSGLTEYGIVVLSSVESIAEAASPTKDTQWLPLIAKAGVAVVERARLSRPSYQRLGVEVAAFLSRLGRMYMTNHAQRCSQDDDELVCSVLVDPVSHLAVDSRGIEKRLTETGQTAAFRIAVEALWEMGVFGHIGGFNTTEQRALRTLAQLHSTHGAAVDEQFDVVRARLLRATMMGPREIDEIMIRFRREQKRQAREPS